MSAEVAGIDLATLEEPIHDALTVFQDISDNRIVFNLAEAPTLSLTPEKPNAARSATTVKHLGEAAGTLYVIAFAPFDGTGDENTYSRDKITFPYPLSPEAKLIPRAKRGVASEINLPLVSQFAEIKDAHQAIFAGNLDLMGVDEAFTLKRIGRLGQEADFFIKALQNGVTAEPTPRLTTGYNSRWDKRFGDPHAVYNPYPNVVQVAAFLAITDELAEIHDSMIAELDAVPGC